MDSNIGVECGRSNDKQNTENVTRVSGLYKDNWLQTQCEIVFEGVPKMELTLFLPQAEGKGEKNLLVGIENQTHFKFEVKRGSLSKLIIEIPRWRQRGVLRLRFSEPEKSPADHRKLGAVLHDCKILIDNTWKSVMGEFDVAEELGFVPEIVDSVDIEKSLHISPPPPQTLPDLKGNATSVDIEIVKPYFDEYYYRSQVVDVPHGLDQAIDHYLSVGWKALLDPAPEFSTEYYLKTNPELQGASINPYVHYVQFGQYELRAGKKYIEIFRKTYEPLVSVIVPNFNHAQFLEERLKSIYNQSYRNIEIILLDDCSTDNSVEVMERLSESSPFLVKKIYNNSNGGSVFSQWQKGIERAEGELVWICESDDFCEPDFLERLVPYFSDLSTMIAFGRIQLCNEGGDVNYWLDQYRENAEAGIWSKPIVRTSKEWFLGGFGCNNLIANVGGCLLRKQPIEEEIWKRAKGFKICGDWYLYIHIARGGTIAFDPGAVSYFRQHESNTSATNFDKVYYYEEHQKVFDKLCTHWELPPETRDKFWKGLSDQWAEFGLLEQYGYLNEVLEVGARSSKLERSVHIMLGSLGFMAGGGELLPINLANSLLDRGYTVSMCCFNLAQINKSMLRRLDPRVSVYDATDIKLFGPRRFLEKIGVNLLHSHVVNVDELFFLSKEGLEDFPYVVSLHGSHDTVDGQSLDRFLGKMRDEVGAWAYTAEKNLKIFEGITIDQSRLHKVANAMPADDEEFELSRKELGVAPNALLFTLVARGVQRKGWRAAIEALKVLTSTRPELKIHLALVGEGEMVEVAKEISTSLPVSFLGFRSRINGLYRISDVAIVPTRFAGESYPLCIIQALQEGVPVIATDIGEISNMLTDDSGRTAGEVLPLIRDTSEFSRALSDAMERMFDSVHYQNCAMVAETLGSKYSMNVMTKKYELIYRDLIKNHASRVSVVGNEEQI